MNDTLAHKRITNTMRNISEADFSSQVEGMLDMFGWRWTHSRPGRTKDSWRTPISGHKGFPDYVAVKDGRLLFIELKSNIGKLSPEQQEWIDAIRDSGHLCYLWRPRDSDTAEQILRGV